MTSQGDLPVTFHKSAVRFDVAESDYLLLQSLGIATANSFAFRVPKADDLETFLQEKLLNACAYKNEDGVIVTFNKNPPVRWTDWKLSEDAAALRIGSGGSGSLAGRLRRARWRKWLEVRTLQRR